MNEEIFNSVIQEIKSIFLFLTEEEPTPDDEIEAREKLIVLFKDLKKNNANREINDFIEDIIKDLENWDTLDLWFKEVDSLITGIKKIFEIVGYKKQPGPLTGDGTISGSQLEQGRSMQDASAELLDIVAHVSEQFKGQIESLKDRIQALQEELDKKTELLEETKKEEPALLQDTPIEDYKEQNNILRNSGVMNKQSKLEPPKIFLPQIKVTSPKSDDEEMPLELSEMEDTLRELSKMEDNLQILSEVGEKKKKSKIIPEVVEEEVTFTKIPKMNRSDLTEIPKAVENGFLLSEIPKMPLAENQEVSSNQKHSKKKVITPQVIEKVANEKEILLTEIQKVVPNNFIEGKHDEQINPSPLNKNSSDFIAIASHADSSIPKDSKKKPLIPDVIEENLNSRSRSLEGSLFMPEMLKKEEKSLKNSGSPKESSKANGDAIFMLKKPSVKLDDINTDSIKTTRTDLYDVFSSFSGHKTEDGEFKETPIDAQIETEEKSKKKKKQELEDDKIKKKEKKKEKIKKIDKPSKSNDIITKKPEDIKNTRSIIDYDNLPRDKDMLYQDLIALEGKRYSIEKGFKELENAFTNRTLNENEFRRKSNDLSARLKEISSNITKLRNTIAKL